MYASYSFFRLVFSVSMNSFICGLFSAFAFRVSCFMRSSIAVSMRVLAIL